LLDTPSGGEHYLKGDPVENLSASQRARVRNRDIGFIFQAFNLIGDLNVYENVELPLTYRGMPAKERQIGRGIASTFPRTASARRASSMRSTKPSSPQSRTA
jgi:putative ABC transport system ATP-binding protein